MFQMLTKLGEKKISPKNRKEKIILIIKTLGKKSLRNSERNYPEKPTIKITYPEKQSFCSQVNAILLRRNLLEPDEKTQKLLLLFVSQDCPLVLVLRMFELCCDYRNFSEAKAKLLDFQRTLLSVSTALELTPATSDPLAAVNK